MVVLLPVSVHQYGWLNLLWLSNLALVAGLAALWLEGPRIASMIAVAVLIPELGWIVGYISGLLRGGDPWLGVTAYMFNPDIPIGVRALALYHVVLPWLILWMVWRLGYDRGAFRQWLPLGWALLLLSWLLTGSERNLNWTWGPLDPTAGLAPRLGWLLILGGCATLVWWLTHLALLRTMPENDRTKPGASAQAACFTSPDSSTGRSGRTVMKCRRASPGKVTGQSVRQCAPRDSDLASAACTITRASCSMLRSA